MLVDQQLFGFFPHLSYTLKQHPFRIDYCCNWRVSW